MIRAPRAGVLGAVGKPRASGDDPPKFSWALSQLK